MFVNGIIILKKGGGGKGSFGVRGIVYTLPPPFFFLFFFGSFFFLFFLSRVAAARSSKIGGYIERAAGNERTLHLHMMRHLVLHPHIRINDPEVLAEIR